VIVADLAPLATPLDDVALLEGNPRVGDVDAIARSLAAFGQRKPVVANRATGEVIAGNHTVRAARQLGWDEVAVVWVDDDPTTAHAFALADNRTAELGGYDDAALAALIAEVHDADEELLAATGWSGDDLQELLDRLEPTPVLAGDPDEVPEAAPAVTAPGDVWRLGDHRLVCGDSSVPATFDTLLGGEAVGCILTDPPYGIDLDTDYGQMPNGSVKARITKRTPGSTFRPVVHDDRPFDASFLRSTFADVAEQFWFGADYYRHTLSPDDMDGSWLVWDKRNEATDVVIGSGFELIWSATRHKRVLLRWFWLGGMNVPEGHNRMHPTQKPSALLAEILNRWAPASCIVLDPFAGSGSTLIACHQTGRVARLVEIDPHYCDVICKRFEQATGIVPVLEATGEERSFL
jgi:hypothetical protein